MAEHENYQPQTTIPTRALPVCDGCRSRISDIRHKCQDCPDFDYCSSCIINASRTHPYHGFTAMDYMTVLPEEAQQEWNAKRNHSTESDRTYRLTGQSTDVPEKVCQSCIGVTKTLATLPFVLQNPEMQQMMGNREFEINWVVRIASLVTATQQGCAFCSVILERFFGELDSFMIEFEPTRLWYMEPGQHPQRDSLVKHAMSLLVGLEEDKFNFRITPKYTRKGSMPPNYDKLRISFAGSDHDQKTHERLFVSRGQLYVTFYVFSVLGTPTADVILSRPPNSAPGSQEGFSTIRKWLRDCEENHPDCRRSPDLEITGHPRRLIDVSSNDGILKLVKLDKHQKYSYAVLSYCWGGPQDFCLTKESYQSRFAGFFLKDLPATLQDAAEVVREVGLQYLWIDALCIVQDDMNDKASQLRIMRDIYRNAQLTICAAKAETAATGFLHNTSDPDTNLRKDLISLGYPVPNTKAISMNEAFQMPNETFGALWLMEEKPSVDSGSGGDRTSERGWCLQEKYLSPRFLQYGRWPTWRCNTLSVSDGGWHYEKGAASEQVKRFSQDILKSRSELPDPSLDLFGVQQLMQTWRALVTDFTTRELSLYADKLPAIAGIAAEIERRSSVQYCAGLWQNNLLFDMMWYARAKEWLTRHDTVLAPTWSWASVDCPITYGDITEDAVSLTRVLDCQINQENELSSVTGYITLRGPVRQVSREDVMKLLSSQNMGPSPPKSNDVKEWDAQILEMIKLTPRKGPTEQEVQEKFPDRVFAILTYTRSWFVRFEERIESACYSGLLLTQREDGGFERMGCFMNGNDEWMAPEESSWRTETIQIY